MLKELFYSAEEPRPYKKEWTFKPEWMLTGLNTPVCVQLLVDKPEYTVGKNDENDGSLWFNKLVSGKHAVLRCGENGLTVEDLQSTNGTLINGSYIRPHEPMKLKDGDRLQIATSYFLVEKVRAEERK